MKVEAAPVAERTFSLTELTETELVVLRDILGYFTFPGTGMTDTYPLFAEIDQALDSTAQRFKVLAATSRETTDLPVYYLRLNNVKEEE